MKILFIGDIVGRPARTFLKENLRALKISQKFDAVIANGENAAGGSSLTLDTAGELFSAGIDIVTSGDHIFKKSQARQVLQDYDVIRPLNLGPLVAGKGYCIKQIAGVNIAVVNLVGRVFMQPSECPFNSIKNVLEDIRKVTKVIIVDMHAEATSEKLAMGYFLASKVSAVLGTHTHIPTADERIIDNYTAYITDVGMTGSFDSVLGRQKEDIIERFVTNMPVRFGLAHDDVRAQGVVIEVDVDIGKAISIQRVEYKKDKR